MSKNLAGNVGLETGGPSFEDFVAELTEAAYPVALRHKENTAWLDLELDLWKALTQTVKNWQERQLSPFSK